MLVLFSALHTRLQKFNLLQVIVCMSMGSKIQFSLRISNDYKIMLLEIYP